MSEKNDLQLNDAELRGVLNAQTGQIGWDELAPHFARGAVLRIQPGQDLVEVALHIVRDHKARVEAWMQAGVIAQVSSEEADRWHREQARFWAVVVTPWVLVQERVERE